MKKALVTGGNGFIGSHLVDALSASGWDVTVLDMFPRRYDTLPKGIRFIQGDLCQEYTIREAILGIDIVFHLAWTSIHEVSNRDPIADVQANLIPTLHLLEACRIEKVKRVVFLSSGGTIYGKVNRNPIPVDQPRRPITSYGINKMAVEEYLRMYLHLYGQDYAILRPSVPFGPRQNPLGRQGAPSVFLYRIAYGLPVNIWGDGEVTRDYFYIEDLVTALMLAATCQLDNQRVYNVGGKESISLNQLINVIEEIVGRKAFVNFNPEREFDAPHIKLDTLLIEEILHWKPHYTLPEGLTKTWDWISTVIPKPN